MFMLKSCQTITVRVTCGARTACAGEEIEAMFERASLM
jgi:hypothetical protein